MLVFLLFQQESDQHGTDRLVGVFSTEEKAVEYQRTIRTRRTFIKPVTVDSPIDWRS